MKIKRSLLAICLQSGILIANSAPVSSSQLGSVSHSASPIQLRALSPMLDLHGQPALQGQANYLEKPASRVRLRISGMPPLAAKLATRLHTLRVSRQSGRTGANMHTQRAQMAISRPVMSASLVRFSRPNRFTSSVSKESIALRNRIASFSQMFNLKAVKPCACGGKGALLVSQHKWVEAANYYRASLRNRAPKPGDLNEFAWALAHTGRLDQSIDETTLALHTSDSEPALLYGTRGYAYLRKGNIEKATSDLETSTKLNPACADDWFFLSICYSRAGALPKARTALDRAAALGYKDTCGDYVLARRP